jgi:hypothetical protein
MLRGVNPNQNSDIRPNHTPKHSGHWIGFNKKSSLNGSPLYSLFHIKDLIRTGKSDKHQKLTSRFITNNTSNIALIVFRLFYF